VAVDLVGPMPLSARGNTWILVLTDHFSQWADALAIPDATAPTVARALNQNVFCYLGLPKQIHTERSAQFQSQLMGDLCRICGVRQSRTTPYHPQGNGVVEWNNRMLGDALRSLLLGRGQEEWDVVLPQIMPDINGIFASLRAHFGISAIDARARLQWLRRDPHTSLPLQEYAATVMRLAQIEYRDLPQANLERYTYDAFVQSINDLGINQQFLARGVTTVEGALAEGEAYLLASHMHINRGTTRQVDMEPSAAPADPGTGSPHLLM